MEETTSTNDPSERSEQLITKFEDLSNELIYEIFEFLNLCHLYQSFFNLNQRFQNLLVHSYLPINVDFSSISKTTFEFYYTNILIQYQHRIKYLHLPNVFILNRIFSSSVRSFQFTSLKQLSLTFHSTISLQTVFTQLKSLTQLLSLTIKAKGKHRNDHNSHRSMFYSSRMGYPRVMNKNYFTEKPSIFPPAELKSIQYLILDYPISLNEVNTVLSTVPELRYLSLQDLKGSSEEQTKLQPISLNHLKSLCLKLNKISFHQFQSMIENLCKQVQNLSVAVNDEKEYLDASRWKELISFHIPHLRVLDIFLSCRLYEYESLFPSNKSINRFHDAFWSERKWYFEHIIIGKNNYEKYITLYSTNPYRRKDFTLYDQIKENLHHANENNRMDSVRYLNIHSKQAILTYQRYFPNVTELKISNCTFKTNEDSFLANLNNIISIERLTKVDISDICCSFSDIIELLSHAGNIQTLSIDFHSDSSDLILFQRNERFHLGSQTNNVKQLIIKRKISLSMVKFLVSFFIRLEHLEINGLFNHLKQVLRFLVAKTNINTHNLSSLRIDNIHESTKSIYDLAASEELDNDPSIHLEYDGDNSMYLWW